MKVIRNGICYIETEDIEFLGMLPRNILLERKANIYYSPFFKFEKYMQEQSVEYFKNNESIIDYDSVYNLSSDELDNKIKKIEEQLNRYSLEYLSSSLTIRKKLDQNQEYNSDIQKLKYILKSLKDYRNKKSIYDREIHNLEFAKGIHKVQLKYVSAYSKLVPKERIPVSSSHMEALDRSIRTKCEQNARERQESEEIAKHYVVGPGTISIYQKQLGKRNQIKIEEN